MRQTYAILVVVSGFLPACGGGGSSNGDTGSTALTSTATTLRDAASDGTAVASPSGISLNASNPSFSLAEDGTISVSLDSGTLDFAPGDARSGGAAGTTFFANNGNADGAIVTVPASSSLDYTAFGIWFQGSPADLTTVNGPFGVADAGAGFFGVQTTPANMPSTSTASYSGGAVGAIAQGNEIQDLLNGSLQAVADFAASEIDVTIDLVRSNGSAFGQITADAATIGAGTSSFSTAAGGAILDTGQTGELNGSFFGPEAEEIGGQFDLDDGMDRIFGSFGGVEQ